MVEISEGLRKYGRMMDFVDSCRSLGFLALYSFKGRQPSFVGKALSNMHRALVLARDFSASDLPEHYAPFLEVLDEEIDGLRYRISKLEYKERIMRRNRALSRLISD